MPWPGTLSLSGPASGWDSEINRMVEWIKARGENILIPVRVQPGASKDAIACIREGYLLIRLCSPPVDGRANDSLVRFVADRLDIPRSSVRIIQGIKNRKKLLEVAGVSIEDAENRLTPLP
jgi:uncharacterized protein